MSQRIVFLDRKSIVSDIRAPSFVHEWVEHDQTKPDEVVARIKNASTTSGCRLRAGPPFTAASRW